MKLISRDRKKLTRKLSNPKTPQKFGTAFARHGEKLIDEDSTILVDGEPAVVYIGGQVLEPDLESALIETCRRVDYNESARTDGLQTRSKTFGALPRVTLRRDFCTKAMMEQDQPQEAAFFHRLAKHTSKLFEIKNLQRYERQKALVAGILPEWRLPGDVFTSGIVNWNNELRYHHDAGNFPDCWSAMYAFSSDCKGGDLVIPELDLRFSFREPALIMFDGAKLLHGVTPIDLRPLGYRYSVVFYAMKQLCRCGTVEQELARIRSVKSKREVARAAGKKVS